jgi:hypothetical protein
MINRVSLYAAAVLVMGFAGEFANAAVIYTDNFSTEASSGLNVTPTGWTILTVPPSLVAGTVDTLPAVNPYLSCGGTNFCVDTDGSTNLSGELVTQATSLGGTVLLTSGKTYQLTVDISGNQRNSLTDPLQFGLLSSTNTVLAQSSLNIAGSSPFTQYSLTFSPSHLHLYAFEY